MAIRGGRGLNLADSVLSADFGGSASLAVVALPRFPAELS